jgi:hypothetical protein
MGPVLLLLQKLDVELDLSGRESKMTKDLEPDNEITKQMQELFKLSFVRKAINYFKFSFMK